MRNYTYQKQRQTQERRSHNRFDGWLRHQSSGPPHMRFSEKPRNFIIKTLVLALARTPFNVRVKKTLSWAPEGCWRGREPLRKFFGIPTFVLFLKKIPKKLIYPSMV